MLSSKFQAIVNYLNSIFVGRNQEVEGLVLALLSGQHCFLLGAPGTGKSKLISFFCDTISATNFTWQLSRFSTPEELFGPYSMKSLKADKLERVSTGRVQEADIAYLDEVWKANSSILNALLAILNERICYDGGIPKSIPLMSCTMSSNELPESGVGLEALYDRIALRFLVSELDQDQLVRVLMNPVPKKAQQFVTVSDVQAAQAEVEKIVVPQAIMISLAKIRTMLGTKGIQVGVRRVVDAIKVLKAAAWLEGETEVTDDQLGVLSNMFWADPKEKPAVMEILAEVASPTKMLVNECLDAMDETIRSIPFSGQVSGREFLQKAGDAMQALKDLQKRLMSLGQHKPAVQAGILKGQQAIERLTNNISDSFKS